MEISQMSMHKRKSQENAAPQNLDQLLLELGKKYQGDELREHLIVFAKEFPAFVEEALVFWFSWRHRALLEPAQSRLTMIANKAAADVRKDAVKASIIDRIVLSTGKTLRDSTFGELAKEGGWLVKLSKMGKPGEVVGQKLSDAEILKARG
jgi:hypothetical protein